MGILVKLCSELSKCFQFTKLSEVLGTPELTLLSPYLNQPIISANSDNPNSKQFALTDLDYERIPDQILSLLRVGDTRYVIYAFGQSLKPAEYGPVVNGAQLGPVWTGSGPNFGLPLNYQITGEVATRAVVRVDFDLAADSSKDMASPNFQKFDYSKPHVVIESFNLLPPN